jgi:hypothetical protein
LKHNERVIAHSVARTLSSTLDCAFLFVAGRIAHPPIANLAAGPAVFLSVGHRVENALEMVTRLLDFARKHQNSFIRLAIM